MVVTLRRAKNLSKARVIVVDVRSRESTVGRHNVPRRERSDETAVRLQSMDAVIRGVGE